MVNFIRRHMENIVFVLFMIFFILGIENIIFMYVSMGLIVLYFMITNGFQGVSYILLLMASGVVIALIFHYFGDAGKYVIIVVGLLYIAFVTYKRYKSGKKLWYWEESDND